MTAPTPTSNRRIVLASRPTGLPRSEDFRLEVSEVPNPQHGQVLIRHVYLGLAPAARLRMSLTDSYTKPLDLGEVVYGQAVGMVVDSRDDRFRPGDAVTTMNGGWQEYSLAAGAQLTPIDVTLAPMPAWLGVLGASGMTAYVGLLDIGRAQPGETVVVSAASGAVGSAVGQIAKLKGCRVVGIAGGEKKCAYATGELGFDACVDYRSSAFGEDLRRACATGIDVSFENVGGVVRDTVWPLLNLNARIVLCGLISEYNTPPRSGPPWFPLLTKRISLQGFILSDRLHRKAAFLEDMRSWYAAGLVKQRLHVSFGLESTAEAFIGMLQGQNFGKTLVCLDGGDDPRAVE